MGFFNRLRGHYPYYPAPTGLRDISLDEKHFAQELIALLKRHKVNYQKIRRLRTKDPAPSDICQAIHPPNEQLMSLLDTDLRALLKKYKGKAILKHSILNMESGHHFLQHRRPLWINRLLGNEVFERYPAGSFGRVKKVVGVFETETPPYVSLVKILKGHVSTQDMQKESEGLDTLGQKMAVLTRNNNVSNPRHYLHQVFFKGQSMLMNQFTARRLFGFRTRRFYEKLVLSGLANLSMQFDRHLLHLDIKMDNLIVTPEGRIALIDYGASTTFRDNEPGKQVPFGRCREYRRDEQIPTNLGRQQKKVGPTDDLLAFALNVCESLGLYVPSYEPSDAEIRSCRANLPEKVRRCRRLSKPIRELLITCLSYNTLTEANLNTMGRNGTLNPLAGLVDALPPKMQTHYQNEKAFAEQHNVDIAEAYRRRMAETDADTPDWQHEDRKSVV